MVILSFLVFNFLFLLECMLSFVKNLIYLVMFVSQLRVYWLISHYKTCFLSILFLFLNDMYDQEFSYVSEKFWICIYLSYHDKLVYQTHQIDYLWLNKCDRNLILWSKIDIVLFIHYLTHKPIQNLKKTYNHKTLQ